MTKRSKNMKFKKKGSQSAIYDPVKGRLMSLFSAGWLFLEIKNLNRDARPCVSSPPVPNRDARPCVSTLTVERKNTVA
jgi:hypothetical protein